MKKIISIIFILITSQLFAQSHKQIVDEMIKKYQSHQSISYDIDYSIKYFDSDESFLINSRVYIEKDNRDSVFHSKFLYNRSDSLMNIIKYYNPPYLYIIDINREKIIKSDASKGANYIGGITGSVDGSVKDTYFLNIDALSKKLKSRKENINIGDSLNFLKIEIFYPDEGDLYDGKEVIYIDKADKTISKLTYQVKYKDQIQRNVWSLSNIKFDQLKDIDFDRRVTNYMNRFTIEDYEPPTEDDFKLLEIGSAAPKITGTLFPDYEKNIELNYDKITILDFWYTSCMPCIETIPHLNSLQEKYRNSIEVVGVNPVEYKEKDEERISAFLNRTPIDYTILLPEKVPLEFNIRAYPTLYIIDAKGRVRYSKIGLSEDTYEVLDEVLSKLTDEN